MSDRIDKADKRLNVLSQIERDFEEPFTKIHEIIETEIKQLLDPTLYKLNVLEEDAVNIFETIFRSISEHSSPNLSLTGRYLNYVQQLHRMFMDIQRNFYKLNLIEKEQVTRFFVTVTLQVFISGLVCGKFKQDLEIYARMLFGDSKPIGKLITELFRKGEENVDSWFMRISHIINYILLSIQVCTPIIEPAVTGEVM